MTTQTPWIEPEIFATIATNEDGLTPCTPAEPNVRRWRGIVINAPTVARARAGQAFFIPVCMVGMIPTLPREPLLIVATDLSSKQTFKGPAFIEKVWGDEARDPFPSKPFSDEELGG